jgi:hypothetical protein
MTRQASKLDESKPYGVVYGGGPILYEQNGKYYLTNGIQVNGLDDRRPARQRKRKSKI